MLVFTINNTKKFMSMLLKENIFDDFEVRSAVITTFTTFDISGKLNKDYFENQEEITADYCKWKDIKQTIFEIIKGNRLPKFIKLVFAADSSLNEDVSPLASVLFLNVTFENNEITLITGSSMRTFTMEKTAEQMWDEYVKDFLSKNGIVVRDRIE